MKLNGLHKHHLDERIIINNPQRLSMAAQVMNLRELLKSISAEAIRLGQMREIKKSLLYIGFYKYYLPQKSLKKNPSF
jgi:hypothetical protein